MENGRASRPRRTSSGRHPSDRSEFCLHRWSVDAAHATGTGQFGRPVRHRRRVSERRPSTGPVHDHSGLRFDHSRAISQDVPEFDALVQETGRTIEGRGTLYTWNLLSPRLGAVVRLDTAGRTILRANAGRFSQGDSRPVSSRWFTPVGPGTRSINGSASVPNSCVIPVRSELDSDVRPPHTDQYSIGLDREVGGRLALSRRIRPEERQQFHWMDRSRWRISNVTGTVDQRSQECRC